MEKYGTVSAGLRYEHVGFDYIDNLNAQKSKYKGTGAGKAGQERMGSN